MASLLTFEVLPSLNEGDERISLADILAIRDSCLSEQELWAVCRECCLAIEGINNSPDMFQTLCITPDSLAFDSTGAACFLDLATDPEQMYVPPEYETVGNSYKAHLYSLGMTMLYAAAYAVPDKRDLDTQLDEVISLMTCDEYDLRLNLEQVLDRCLNNLGEESSLRICREITAIAKLELSGSDTEDRYSLSQYSFNDQFESHTFYSTLRELDVELATASRLMRPPSSLSSSSAEPELSDVADEDTLPAAGEENHLVDEANITDRETSVEMMVNREGEPDPVRDDDSVDDIDDSDQENETKTSLEGIRLKMPLPGMEELRGKKQLPGIQELPVFFNNTALADNKAPRNLSTNGDNDDVFVDDAEMREPDASSSSEGEYDATGIPINNETFEKFLQSLKNENRYALDGAKSNRSTSNVKSGETESAKWEVIETGMKKEKDPLDSVDSDCDENADVGDMEEDTTLVGDNVITNNLLTNEVPSGGEPWENIDTEEEDCREGEPDDLVVKITVVENENNEGNRSRRSSLKQTLSWSSDDNVLSSSKQVKTVEPAEETIDECNISVSRIQFNDFTPIGSTSLTPIPRNEQSPSPPSSARSLATDEAFLATGEESRGGDHPLSLLERVLSPCSMNTSTSGLTRFKASRDGRYLTSSPAISIEASSIDGSFMKDAAPSPAKTTVAYTSVFGKRDQSADNSYALTASGGGSSSTADCTATQTIPAGSTPGNPTDINANHEKSWTITEGGESVETSTRVTMDSTKVRNMQGSTKSGPGREDGQDNSPDLVTQVSSGENDFTHCQKKVTNCPHLLFITGIQNDWIVPKSGWKNLAYPKSCGKIDGQTIQDLLDKLGLPLHENELWSLCHECVRALQRYKNELPAYISLETVTVEMEGQVEFHTVPEDRELEVVYLSTELQQNGVVTEKTCLFGIAAMLWLAADYKLPANQEPALSDELESLLISMTQDDPELRPSVDDVLQICSDYEKRQDTTSTNVCQSLYTDAQKAAQYGKHNRLVQDYIDEQHTQHVELTRTSIMDSIKQQLNSVSLKPVSERQLADKPIVRSLHDKLMEEIRSPKRRLRKSSRPKLMTVKEIYLANPKFLDELVFVTGKQKRIKTPNDIAKMNGTSTSAFNSIHQHRANMAAANATNANRVPSPYNSPATHFSPIVLSGNHQPVLNAADKKSPGIPPTSEREKKVAQKLKELKKNLMKNRAPISLVQDLEKEVETEERASSVHSGTVRSPAYTPHSEPYGPTSPHNHNFSPSQVNHFSPTHLPQYTPPQTSLSLHSNNFSPSQPAYMNMQQMGVLSQSTPNLNFINTQMGPMVQGQPMMNQQGNFVNVQPMQQQFGAYPQGHAVMPQSQIPAQSSSGMPFQVQLQPDPRTGFFQLVPIPNYPVNTQENMNNHYVNTNQVHSPVVSPTMSPEPVQRGRGNDYVTYADLVSALNLKEGEGGKERKHYVKNVSKLKSKEKSIRSRADQTHHHHHHKDAIDRSKSIPGRSAEKGYEAPRTRTKSRDQKHRSRTLGSLEMHSDIDKAIEIVRKGSRGEYERDQMKKSNSEEFLDQIDSKSSQRTHEHQRPRGRLKRAKSGSSIDYKNQLVVHDVPIESSKHSSNLQKVKSQPNLESGLSVSERRSRHHTRESNGIYDASSPIRSPLGISPPASPSSPSLSKDSGVSGLNLKTGDASLMERLLNSDTLRHQQKLSKVIRLLRDEFAYEGYMENGVEDLAMAEYILSLGNLKWDTFNNAVSEKYCDLFWQEDLLISLFEAVNGQKPVINTSYTSGTSDVRRNQQGEKEEREGWDPESAFRPVITAGKGGQLPLGADGPMFKPRAKKANGGHTDSESSETEKPERPRRTKRKQALDKAKSYSMHELANKKQLSVYSEISKSQSDELLDTHDVSPTRSSPPRSNGLYSKEKSPYRSSKGLENEVNIYGVKSAHRTNNNSTAEDKNNINSRTNTQVNQRTKQISKSNHYLYRYDSDSSSVASERCPSGPQADMHRRQQLRAQQKARDDAQTVYIAHHPVSSRRLAPAKSESFLSSGNSYESDSSQNDRSWPSRTEGTQSERVFQGSVIYYGAEMEDRLRPDIRDYAKQIWNKRRALSQDTRTRESLESKMFELDQQMMVEHRMKKKTLKFHQKLVDACRSNRATPEQKSMAARMSTQLSEMTTKLSFLNAAKKHLEMLHAEQWSLPHELLYCLAKCPGDQPMLLSMAENPLLQYQSLQSGTAVLQAGTPLGLMSYLYAQYALSESYIHQFFYCYRYFVTPIQLFEFLQEKFCAASLSLSPEADIPMKVKSRTLHLIQVWIEGYFTVDFKHNQELTSSLYNFIREKVVPIESHAEQLLELLEDCQDGRHTDLHYPQFFKGDDDSISCVVTDANSPKKWESFKAALHLSAKPVKIKPQPVKPKVTCVDKRTSSAPDGDVYLPRGVARKSDIFTLGDYTSQMIAEQLTLMQQELFRESHPVHYLNSKAQGIGVALTNNPSLGKAPSMSRLNSAWEDSGNTSESSLFEGTFITDDIIQRLIEHAQAVAFWVAAEILSSVSSKAQIAALTKFIYTAKICHEMKNYATCIAILDGLETIIVRQVPAWRSLPTKCVSLMEELTSVRVFLKTDAMCLTDGPDSVNIPTIPCILLFLLHVQQLEIGGFRLANGMMRWAKIRSIAKVIDQIRVFRGRRYTFVPDLEFQEAVGERMQEFGQQDLHTLASQHDTNFHKMTSKRIHGAFKRMRHKFQGKSMEG